MTEAPLFLTLQLMIIEENKRDRSKDPVIQALIEGLQKRLGGTLKEMWLFGSRARGDYSDNSDYDVLVVADDERLKLERIVLEEEYRILYSMDELVAGPIYDVQSWERASNSPFGWNVRKEGIRLI